MKCKGNNYIEIGDKGLTYRAESINNLETERNREENKEIAQHFMMDSDIERGWREGE
jgi:hypothetical protein